MTDEMWASVAGLVTLVGCFAWQKLVANPREKIEKKEKMLALDKKVKSDAAKLDCLINICTAGGGYVDVRDISVGFNFGLSYIIDIPRLKIHGSFDSIDKAFEYLNKEINSRVEVEEL